MSEWLPIGIASLAIVISIVSFICNWRHSESVIRRSKYPAVAWHRPVLSKREMNTSVSVSICNHGPTEITAVWLGALLSSRLTTKGWCMTNPIMGVPSNEELSIAVTENLEEDIRDLFSDLGFDDGWHCEGKPHAYKIAFRLEYQPLIADASPLARKYHYLLRPDVEEGVITSWQIVPISWPRSLFPAF